mmetsp:Transcript_7021/g.10668  ORF Transcript_7021/g.10668 Transcript_7021/m.10668 type:complete len:208 (-) Transcript_7021:109-732(-)
MDLVRMEIGHSDFAIFKRLNPGDILLHDLGNILVTLLPYAFHYWQRQVQLQPVHSHQTVSIVDIFVFLFQIKHQLCGRGRSNTIPRSKSFQIFLNLHSLLTFHIKSNTQQTLHKNINISKYLFVFWDFGQAATAAVALKTVIATSAVDATTTTATFAVTFAVAAAAAVTTSTAERTNVTDTTQALTLKPSSSAMQPAILLPPNIVSN